MIRCLLNYAKAELTVLYFSIHVTQVSKRPRYTMPTVLTIRSTQSKSQQIEEAARLS